MEKIVETIDGVLNFGQSMSDYFAHDDALEPALAAVCEVLRSNPNIGSILDKRCTSFLALAQCYQKHSSHNDKDFCATISGKGTNFGRKPQNAAKNSIKRYTRGLCFNFQENGCFRGTACNFAHKCDKCGSYDHGANACKSYNRQ